MKKFSILALTLMLAFSFASCSKEALKDQAKKQAVDTVVNKTSDKAADVATAVVCKSDCDKTFDACVKKAGKNKKKAAACDKAKTKCYADCEKKK